MSEDPRDRRREAAIEKYFRDLPRADLEALAELPASGPQRQRHWDIVNPLIDLGFAPATSAERAQEELRRREAAEQRARQQQARQGPRRRGEPIVDLSAALDDFLGGGRAR